MVDNKIDPPKTEVEFLRDVVAEDKRRSKWYDSFIVGVIVGAFFSVIVFSVLDLKLYKAKEKLSRQHIETVTMTDKNCNDCHLGASFVNLFNHPAVKGNDNTVNLMMDKAKIKRW